MSRGVVLEQNSSRRDGREFGQTMNKNYRHKRCARSCAARASKKNEEEKKKTNFNSLTLPPKELEAQEMRPLLRRPRFEEKNKKENKIQHHFLDCAAKKNQTQAMCLLFRRRRFERNCRKSKWQPHPTFFSGWWLSHD